MATQLEQIEAARRALSPESLLPAYRLDDATRERYRNQPVRRGVAYTKSEQLNLGQAVDTSADLEVRTSSQ